LSGGFVRTVSDLRGMNYTSLLLFMLETEIRNESLYSLPYTTCHCHNAI